MKTAMGTDHMNVVFRMLAMDKANAAINIQQATNSNKIEAH
jgi:hypothetical protein